MSISETSRGNKEPRDVQTKILQPQREDESISNYLSRVRETLRNMGGGSVVLGLPPDLNSDSNRVAVMDSKGETLLSQRPEEPFSEFCARIGKTLKERGFSGAYLIPDRVNMYEPIGVIVAG